MIRTCFVAAAFALALYSAPAFARVSERTLLKDFDHGKAEERIRLAPALGRIGGRKAVESLLLALDVRHGNPRESEAIVSALAVAGDARAVSELSSDWDYLRTLIMQMGDLPAPQQILRGLILEALGRCGGDRAVAILEEAVNDKDARIVEQAVRGLGRLQVKAAVPALLQLSAQGGDMTQAVFEALAAIGDKSAVATLERGLNDPDPFVAVEACYALVRLGRKDLSARLEAALKNDPGAEKVGILAAYYLARLDRVGGLDHLTRLMKKTDSPYAARAAEALAKSENRRAILPLVEASSSPDASVRLAVARGLGLLGGNRAASALKALTGDANPGVRSAAQASLIALGEAD